MPAKVNLNGMALTLNPVLSDCTVQASFSPNIYTVTASATGPGSISPTGPITASSISVLDFSVTPETGSTALITNTCGNPNPNSYVYAGPNDIGVGNLTRSCAIAATFVPTPVLTASATPLQAGQSLHLTASNIYLGAGPVTVTFYADQPFVIFESPPTHVALCTVAVSSGQIAQCDAAASALAESPLPQVEAQVQVPGYGSIESNTIVVDVSRVSTTTTLTSSANPSSFGQTVSLVATVSKSDATGTVTFLDNDSAQLCYQVTVMGGAATCKTSALSGEAHAITAVYSGDAVYTSSTSQELSQQVSFAQSTTSLSSTTNPSVSAQSVTFVATVAGRSPTGTVTFLDQGIFVCDSVKVVSSIASCTTTTLSVGTHSVSATYSGDADNLPSASTAVAQVVQASVNGIVLSSDSNPSTFGQRVKVVATVAGTAPSGTVTISDGATPVCSDVVLANGHARCSLALSVGSHALTAAYSGDANNPASTSVPLVQTVSGSFVPLDPQRILDTRAGRATVDGKYSGVGPVAAKDQLDLAVLGRGELSDIAVDAVVLNVTATNPTSTGFLTVWPTGSQRPVASNLNFTPGVTVSNLVIVNLGNADEVSVFNSAGSTDIAVDVVGYFATGSDFVSTTPQRLLDTRVGGKTVDYQFAGQGALPKHGQVDLAVAGRRTFPVLPATGIGAAILNVTATNPTANGFVTLWPADQSRPTASALNFAPGQTIANLAIGKLSADGKVSLFNSAGTTDLIADISGYFPSNADLNSLTPARLLDTRAGQSTVDGQQQAIGAIAAKTVLDLPVVGRGGVPPNGVGAVVLSITVTGPAASGFLVTWPSSTTRPATSNINFAANQTIAGLAIVKVGANGDVSLFANATTDVLVDVVGWMP